MERETEQERIDNIVEKAAEFGERLEFGAAMSHPQAVQQLREHLIKLEARHDKVIAACAEKDVRIVGLEVKSSEDDDIIKELCAKLDQITKERDRLLDQYVLPHKFESDNNLTSSCRKCGKNRSFHTR